jgi:glycerophosphoryl diester phosphodiesterase
MAGWRRAGALVNTWTVNEGAEALRLSELGVDAIISDTPGAILAALAAD